MSMERRFLHLTQVLLGGHTNDVRVREDQVLGYQTNTLSGLTLVDLPGSQLVVSESPEEIDEMLEAPEWAGRGPHEQ
jgi:hypothetical protein